MMHEVLEGLAARGWDCRIVAVEHRGPAYERNGITVEALSDAEMVGPYSWCDVALTHLDVTPMAMAWARYGRPLLHLVHNHRQLLHHRVPDNGRNVAVWNSEWIIPESGGWNGPQIVVHPPVRPELHDTGTLDGRRSELRTATLVNLLDQKGGPLLWRLAERLPDWHFIGVEGAYGYQTIPDPLPANGEVVRQTDDLRSVWARTSVCLAPSWYESWGLAAVEALASGIPVIAHPTPGLLESMTSDRDGWTKVGIMAAGVRCAQFVDREDIDGWVNTLRHLEDLWAYSRWEAGSRARAEQLGAGSIEDLDRLAAFCVELATANQGAAAQ